MATRYCISSGVWTDTAIWSETEGGEGGASVPGVTDTKIFAADATVTSAYGSILSYGSLRIQNGANVTLTAGTTPPTYTFQYDGQLSIDGTLNTNMPLFRFEDNTKCILTPGSLLNMTKHSTSSPSYFADTAQLVNEGTIRFQSSSSSPPTIFIDFEPGSSTVKHQLGNIANIRPKAVTNTSYKSIFGSAPAVIDKLYIARAIANKYVKCRFESETAVLSDLWFNNVTENAVTIENTDIFNVYGNIKIVSGSTGDFELLNTGTLAFKGTNNQDITLPASIANTWLIDKSGDGYLDFKQFAGTIISNPGVKCCSYLIVRGPSTVTIGSDLIVDKIDNYGQIIIPAGVTLKTNYINNKTGGEITGDGLLMYKAPNGYYTDNNSPPGITVATQKHTILRPFIKAR